MYLIPQLLHTFCLGSDNENPESPSEGSNLRDSGSVSITELKEDEGSDDDDRASDMDEEHDLRVNGVITDEDSVSTRFFLTSQLTLFCVLI